MKLYIYTDELYPHYLFQTESMSNPDEIIEVTEEEYASLEEAYERFFEARGIIVDAIEKARNK